MGEEIRRRNKITVEMEKIGRGYMVTNVKKSKGKWFKKYFPDEPVSCERWYCSECGKWQTYGKTKFCMNCGADMMEEDNQKNYVYVIVGDTDKYNDCLICVCGADRNWADQVLQRMLNNPTENDINVMGLCTNLRVEEVLPENCWWNDTTD